MNKAEVLTKVSEKSGVNVDDCQKVLDTFEEVLSDELSQSKDISSAFDKVYKVFHYFKNK